jgi:hypothetical protein
MLEEMTLKAFLVSNSIGDHDLDNSLDVTMRKYMTRGRGKGNVERGLSMDIIKGGNMGEHELMIYSRWENNWSREKCVLEGFR